MGSKTSLSAEKFTRFTHQKHTIPKIVCFSFVRIESPLLSVPTKTDTRNSTTGCSDLRNSPAE